jgi:hypothetical protein
VERGDGSRFRAKAHAHCNKGDENKGWICILGHKRLTDRMLMLHELAHLIAPGGHNDRWRQVLVDLGGTLDPTPSMQSYRKRVRKQQEVVYIAAAVKEKPMPKIKTGRSKARFRVVGRFDMASKMQEATVTVDRDARTFEVRPLRRHRTYVISLAAVAELVVRRIIAAEVAEKKKAKKKAKRGLLAVGRAA